MMLTKKRKKKKSLNYFQVSEIVIPDIQIKYRINGGEMGQKENSKTLKIL